MKDPKGSLSSSSSLSSLMSLSSMGFLSRIVVVSGCSCKVDVITVASCSEVKNPLLDCMGQVSAQDGG